jgi:uncharacterized membrane protein
LLGNPVSHGGFVGTGQLRAAFPRHHGRSHIRQEWSRLGDATLEGDPHSIVTIGLLVLTLVPLGRVAFTFILFVKERKRIFALATAYVLAALIAV